MKPAPAIALLALSLGLGAFTHHLTGTPPPSAPASFRPPDKSPPDISPASRRNIDEILAALTKDPGTGELDWIFLTDKLSALSPAHFPQLWAALPPLNEKQLDDHTNVLKFWAAADSAGLIQLAEQGKFHLSLDLCLQHCIHYQPSLVAAAIQRRAAAGTPEDEIGDLWRGAIGIEYRRDPAATVTLVVSSGALKHFLPEPGVSGPPTNLDEALENWTARDPLAAVRFVEKHPELIGTALNSWVAIDPEAAYAWAATHPGHVSDLSWANEGLAKFAKKNPVEAEHFISDTIRRIAEKEGMEETAKLYLREAQAAGMAWQPPEVSTAWIRTLEGDARLVAYLTINGAISQKDPASAVAFVKALPDMAVKAPREVERAFTEFGNYHPAEAVASLFSSEFPQSVRDECLPSLVRSWLMLDYKAASEFINAQPPSELKGELLLQASSDMYWDNFRSPDFARDLALTFPDKESRLGACRALLLNQVIRSKDATPESISAWIAAIPDPAIRAALEEARKPAPTSP